ncbi:alpha-glucan family phosphorylase [Saccharothrix coeruleofusca]|uniref:glycogen phosphorylase n=1 Tax=Saccharothrix coeruleofusca TaxID=33919 RepID=A0A918AJS0_9PSEU|nr:alpha-glucan family phosphorylase [Saccharothrix coeruleofusca]MBP2338690.1 starch phosphorylase [Saccharothrix coeruleofusca]GGP46622.1 alpha-1,4 glucan phosphorylase [Saccharothrix coeruleofusca]
MRALRRFTVRASLPEPLSALGALATNLRWTWHQPTQDLFASVDAAAWADSGDPLRLLSVVDRGRLEELARDEEFLGRVRGLAEDLHRYTTEPRWYQQRQDELRQRREHGEPDAAPLPGAVAYFSMEFGVTEALPNYSGGLGVLAGDHLKAASDLGVPLIAVGLLYHSGYFRQALSLDGWQIEHYPVLDPQGLPLELLTESSGAPVLVHVAMPGDRVLRAKVWKAQVGRVPLLLLDSDVEGNDEDLRGVTDRLYGGDQDHRIRQEILAGIGGVRAVRTFCDLTGHPSPEVFHTNEGHAGFLGLERIRELITGEGLDFDQALAAVRAGTVFTTHTPVPAGIDRFPVDLVQHYFGAETLVPGVNTQRLLALGAEENPGLFNMAHMGLRLAQRANGVSKLHGAVSRDMFRGLWPGFDAAEVPIRSVTNGVHGPTWAATEMGELFGEGRGDEVSDQRLWELRNGLRAKLVHEVRRRTRASWLQRGASALELGWTDSVFDPDVLTVGFARRVPTYKRLTLMLRDPERLRALLLHPERPVQLVVAGKSHPADDGGKALIQQIVRFADDAGVRHRIVFLPDYDMSMARYLYWGCDVWLNNPMRPLEACGTSGMKSALNGGLNLSIRDGWWDELYDGGNGWAIPTADGVGDPNRRDDLEAAALYDLLGSQVAPLFYDRGEDGVPTRWLAMVRHTLTTLGPAVQATRMVREYVQDLYAPAAASAASVVGDGYRGAKEVAAYRQRLRASWTRVRVLDSELEPEGSATPLLGAPVRVRARVELAGLEPSEVDVQAVLGRVGDSDELHDAVAETMRYVGNGNYEVEVPLPHAGSVGYTVRVLPRHDLLASRAELGRVVLAN